MWAYLLSLCFTVMGDWKMRKRDRERYSKKRESEEDRTRKKEKAEMKHYMKWLNLLCCGTSTTIMLHA